MLDTNNSEKQAEELKQRIQEETETSLEASLSSLPSYVSTLADLDGHIHSIEKKIQVRAQLPKKLNRFPFNRIKILECSILKVLELLFRDQRIVNESLIDVLKLTKKCIHQAQKEAVKAAQRMALQAQSEAGKVAQQMALQAQAEAVQEMKRSSLHQLGVIYYWVESTRWYPRNSGIQRVVRGLARALIEMGIKLIPIKWNQTTDQFCLIEEKECEHLAKWNGPKVSDWSPWSDPSQNSPYDWLLVPELVVDHSWANTQKIRDLASHYGLRSAAIFFDAIPWKMQSIYPTKITASHSRYMEELNEFEHVFAISDHSREDLYRFFTAIHKKTFNQKKRWLTCELPGEFQESKRNIQIKTRSSNLIKILCVSTIDPRKNHLNLLKAFQMATKQTTKQLELYLVGTDLICPAYSKKISKDIQKTSNVYWEKKPGDKRLHSLFEKCEFTIYPSIEEGYGLPIMESLWHARPCICHKTGAMAELAKRGGCLSVDLSDPNELTQAILLLVEDDKLRLKLAGEAISRPFKTWHDYAYEVATHLAMERSIPRFGSRKEKIESSDN